MESLPFIGSNLVKKYLKYSELIPAVKRALQEYSQNRSVHPLRTAITIPRSNGTILSMPGYCATDNTLVTKIIGMYPDNIPTRSIHVMLLNPDNGKLQCMMDGAILTHMRTAAASVVATQTVVKRKPEVLAILGTGLQARSHIEAFCSVYEFEKCYETIENAVKDADVIVTATTASKPILFGSWLKDGAHVNSVGACRPTMRECDDECLTNATVYVDSKESAENESGDVIMSKANVYAEIGEILLEEKALQDGRHHTFFKSLGLALEDAVAANLVWMGVNNVTSE